jgi:hypothetical protein
VGDASVRRLLDGAASAPCPPGGTLACYAFARQYNFAHQYNRASGSAQKADGVTNPIESDRANGRLILVFSSGRSASLLVDHKRGRQLLEQIAKGESIVGDTLVQTQTGESMPVYAHYIKGAAVTHAVLVKIDPGAAISADDFAPGGFHDGVNRDFTAEREPTPDEGSTEVTSP